MRASFIVFLVAAAGSAAADDQVHRLRMATAAPDGTAWAREFRAFARDVEIATHGQVQVKWYFGGIAGDELRVVDRIHREQLDGTASAGIACQRLAPSARVMSLPGLFESRDEAAHVYSRLTQRLNEEFGRAGFAFLGGPGLGPDVLITRRPVRTLEELRRFPLWFFDLDTTAVAFARALGMNPRPLSLEQGLPAYDAGQVDGFVAPPSALLAFQWTTRARYLTDLRMIYLTGCLLVANRAMDALTIEQQQAVRAAGAKAIARVSDAGGMMDDQLLGGLFAKQGVATVPVAPELRREFVTATRQVRERLANELVPHGLMPEVQGWLDEYRALKPRH
jgi:TRAP-type C4-dicarboxylate transport system substrate-binding protein